MSNTPATRGNQYGDLFPPAPQNCRILDLSAGNGAVWFGKRPSGVIAVDRRPCSETVRADTMALPFKDDAFDLAVFDPPHTNVGPNSFMSRIYGHSTSDEIRALVRGTSKEAARCVRAGGLMALKWNSHSIKLDRVLGLMPEWRPLFGHHVAQRYSHPSCTSWVMLLNLK
jgi:hypothetical protein